MTVSTVTNFTFNVLSSTIMAAPLPGTTEDLPFLENAIGVERLYRRDPTSIIAVLPYRSALRTTFSAWVISKTLEKGASLLGYDRASDLLKICSKTASVSTLAAFTAYQYKMSQTQLWVHEHD